VPFEGHCVQQRHRLLYYTTLRLPCERLGGGGGGAIASAVMFEPDVAAEAPLVRAVNS
jgi:hypothetical protein